MKNPHFYVLVRQDISLADQICQVAHAAADAGTQFGIPPGCNLVLLGVPNQEALINAKELMVRRGIKCIMVEEPDDDLGPTAISSEPIGQDRRKFLRDYRLWRA